MDAAGRRFAARSCLWLLPVNRRVLQRGRDATRDSPGAIISNSGCLREPGDMHVGLQGSWYSRYQSDLWGEQDGRALFFFFRISPGGQAVGVRESERTEPGRNRSSAGETARARGVRGHAQVEARPYNLQRLGSAVVFRPRTEWGSAAWL